MSRLWSDRTYRLPVSKKPKLDKLNKFKVKLKSKFKWGAGQIFNLPRTDDFSRRGKVPSHLTAKVVSTVAFQNKITNLSCTRLNECFSFAKTPILDLFLNLNLFRIQKSLSGNVLD